MKDYMTGSELRQYLHISTRMMKYLMDYNYIPHENTGKPTHKYRILRSDVEAFKLRMEQEPFFLAHLDGHFSSRDPKPPRHIAPFDYSGLKVFLTRRWIDAPDALTIDQAAKLLGTNWSKLLWLNRDGDLQMIVVRGKKYFFKENIIEYLIRPEVTLRPKIGNYKEVVSEFKKKQCRMRENEIRRQKRAAKREKGNEK